MYEVHVGRRKARVRHGRRTVPRGRHRLAGPTLPWQRQNPPPTVEAERRGSQPGYGVERVVDSNGLLGNREGAGDRLGGLVALFAYGVLSGVVTDKHDDLRSTTREVSLKGNVDLSGREMATPPSPICRTEANHVPVRDHGNGL